jgi:hypothetical protein
MPRVAFEPTIPVLGRQNCSKFTFLSSRPGWPSFVISVVEIHLNLFSSYTSQKSPSLGSFLRYFPLHGDKSLAAWSISQTWADCLRKNDACLEVTLIQYCRCVPAVETWKSERRLRLGRRWTHRSWRMFRYVWTAKCKKLRIQFCMSHDKQNCM